LKRKLLDIFLTTLQYYTSNHAAAVVVNVSKLPRIFANSRYSANIFYSNVFVCDCTIKNKTTLSALSFGEKRETVIRDFNECDIIPPWAIAPLIKIVLIRREKKNTFS